MGTRPGRYIGVIREEPGFICDEVSSWLRIIFVSYSSPYPRFIAPRKYNSIARFLSSFLQGILTFVAEDDHTTNVDRLLC